MRVVSRRGEAIAGTGKPFVSHGDLRQLRQSGDGPVRAGAGTARVLQFVLRPGSGGSGRRANTWRLQQRSPAVDWRDRSEQPLEEDRVGVIIIREMVGTSPNSWSDAARQAVATASRTVRNIKTVEVVKSTAIVDDGEITEYRVEIKIGFEYEG